MQKRARLFFNILIACILVISPACGKPATPTPAPATPTLSVAVDRQAAESGPQVVAQTPLRGQRLDLEPVIQVVFDREMDQQTTAAAWSFSDSDGASVPGRVTWKDSRTFEFTPGVKLVPGMEYSGAFSTSASDSEGKAPAEELRLDFHTVDALTVGQAFPLDGAGDVDVGTNITVVFNRPVVPITIEEEQGNLPQPLEFSPEVPGQGDWVNSSMYIFKPDPVLASGTDYSVRVAAGLQDVSGNAMPVDYAWGFTTRPVSGYVDEQAKDNYRLDDTIRVYFLQPMDADSVEKALTVVDRESGKAVPVKMKWAANNILDVQPAGRYRIASFYRLTVADTARAQDGSRLAKQITWDFSTLPLPRIVSTSPAPDSKPDSYNAWFSIQFASPMKLESLKTRVKISPAPRDGGQWYYSDYRWVLNISGLEPGTTYIVRLLPGMADIYGNTIDTEYSYNFKTADMKPYARLLSQYTALVYREHGEQSMFFEYINLDSAQIQLYSISFPEFLKLVGDAKADKQAFRPTTAPIRQWQPDIQGVRNSLVRIKLHFEGEDGTPLPPGYYFIGLKAQPFDTSDPYLQGAIFVVATDNLTFKMTSTEALVWLTDLETGQPTPGVPVEIYDVDLKKIATAETDADGLVYLDGLKTPAFARAGDDKHAAFVWGGWGSGVSAGQFGPWMSYYYDYSPRFVYVYTEKPIYRPGQDVLFTGLVRDNDDLHYSLPGMPSVYVTIEINGEKLYSKSLDLSDSGSFSGSFHLDDEAALGSYQLRVFASAEETKPFGSLSFRVAEYHKPEFQVLAAPSASGVLVGDDFNVDLEASYYSGGSVGNAGVSWYMEASPYYFYPSADYRSYSFSDWDRDQYWTDPEAQTPVTLAEGNARTDENGHLALPQTASLGQNKTSREVQFYADVTDLSGNIVGVHTSLVVHQSEVYAGIRTTQYIGEQGKQQELRLAVLDWDSNPVAGQKVSVDVVQRKWYSVQQQDAQGMTRWVTSVKDVPAAHFDKLVTDKDGLATAVFTPSAGGIYKATVTVRDSKNNTHQASTFLWVSGGEYIPWRQTNDRAFNLVSDKDSYTPGDTAELLIAQPFEGEVYALVTVERGHIYHRQVVRLEGNSTIYKLPVTGEMAPAAYVSVVVISGTAQTGRSNFKIGMARLNVDTVQQTLDVTISADKAAAGPRDQVTYTVHVRDASGKAVQAEISLALVDKAVLALAPSNSLPILNAFYPVRALSVITSLGIVSNADDFNANYTETTAEGENSGGGGGKGAGDEGIIDVREDFRDTAFYRAQLMTDENGTASVTVSLPENLTTWHMDVRAATADSLVGQASHELVSTKPLFVQLQTPRFFTAGDAARIGATIFNNTTRPLTVDVSLEAKGAELLDGSGRKVTIEGRRQAYLTWDLRVLPGAGRVDLTARAVSGSYEDASKPPLGTLDGQGLPVYAFHVTETVGSSGLLTKEDSTTEAFQMPAALSFDDATLNVEINPSLAASVREGVTYLEDYPYSCMEQTTSRMISNLLAVRILRLSHRADKLLQDTLDSYIGSALQRISALQNSDGGWGWWRSESDALTSAYVVFGLMEAQQAGYDIPGSVLAEAADYIKANLPVLDETSSSWEYNRQAFIVYVLALAGKPQAGKTFSIYDQRERLSLYGKAYLAQAISLIDPGDSRLATLTSDLASAAVLSAAGAHWEEAENDYWNWGSDVRTTAIVLNAFIQIDPANPTTASAVRWLVAHRSVNRWGSTQETSWTLIALTNWLETSGEFDTDYSYAVGLNGSLLRQGEADTTNLTEAVKLQIGVKQMLSDQVNYLVFTRSEGTGNLYYTAYMDVSMPVAEIQPLDQGIIVARQYYRLDNSKVPVTEIQRGELVRVRVTIIAPSSLHYVVVNDPLPAGLEPIDASLLTDVQVPSKYTQQDFDERGWGWWYFYHVELHDEKVVLSTDYLPAGTYVYTYLARASSAGTFNVVPVTAEEFYFPDVAGRGAGSVFVVVP